MTTDPHDGEVPLPAAPEVSIVTIHNVVCEDCGTVADDVTADDADQLRQQHIEAHLTVRPRMRPVVTAKRAAHQARLAPRETP